MDVNNLKKYLGMVVDMETNYYLMGRLKKQLHNQLRSIIDPQPEMFYQPTLPEHDSFNLQEPTKPKMEYFHNGGIAVASIISFILAVVCILDWTDKSHFFISIFFLLFGVAFLIYSKNADREYYEETIMPLYWQELSAYQAALSEYKKKIIADEQNYNRQMKDYHDAVGAEQQRIRTIREANEIARKLLRNEMSALNRRMQESARCLQNLYDMGIIFPKYRNLPMVCSLDEYVRSGRCSSLEGADGAYNILEMEMRMDRVITQLDRVITNLRQIQANQYILFSELQESNRLLDKILRSNRLAIEKLGSIDMRIDQMADDSEQMNRTIERIQKSSEFTSYCADRAQKELAYISFMETFR